MKKRILAKVCSILLVVIIFASLMLALMLGGTVPEGQLPILGLGLLAYSFAIFAILLSSRPEFVAKWAGVGYLYLLHGVAGSLLLTSGLIHGIMGLVNTSNLWSEAWVLPTGIAMLIFFLVVDLVGSLALSGKVKMKKKMKREVGLAVHRISLLATILIYVHMLGIVYLRNNVALLVVGGIYLASAIIAYVAYSIRGRMSRKHTVASVNKVNDDVHHLVLSPQNKGFENEAGQYAFFRTVSSSLPKESHPFSMVSTSGNVELYIKESGDYTSRLSELKKGDVVTIDGPYGNFFAEEEINGEKPMVLLAGGIGITPFLGLVRYLKEKGIKKEIHLLWGVKGEKDAFLVDELKAISQALPSFSYSIAYSQGEKKKRVDLSFLEECGIAPLFSKAEFYICGPAGFNSSLKTALISKGVSKKRIHLEEFSF